ncbi:MAG: hypothetical protein BWY87_01073 [Deltaproteobacteria bacterium ADurb.Bin510]|nr:MAG: hypothetical protein BWY87_01073 [Deltaproteobacteria bacterium ADurb.Bin510]
MSSWLKDERIGTMPSMTSALPERTVSEIGLPAMAFLTRPDSGLGSVAVMILGETILTSSSPWALKTSTAEILKSAMRSRSRPLRMSRLSSRSRRPSVISPAMKVA